MKNMVCSAVLRNIEQFLEALHLDVSLNVTGCGFAPLKCLEPQTFLTSMTFSGIHCFFGGQWLSGNISFYVPTCPVPMLVQMSVHCIVVVTIRLSGRFVPLMAGIVCCRRYWHVERATRINPKMDRGNLSDCSPQMRGCYHS